MSMWLVPSPCATMRSGHPIVGVPFFLYSSCALAYGLGKRDQKSRKCFLDDLFYRPYPEKDERVLSIIAWKKKMAGGDKEFRPAFSDTIHLSREAKQELRAERKRERERKRAANGIVRLGLVDATLLTPSF